MNKTYEQAARMVTVLLGEDYYVEGLPDFPHMMRITNLNDDDPVPLEFNFKEIKIKGEGCTLSQSFLAALLVSEAVKLLSDFFDDESILDRFNKRVRVGK